MEQHVLVGHQQGLAHRYAKANHLKYFTFVNSPEQLYGLRGRDVVVMSDAESNPRFHAIVAQCHQQALKVIHAIHSN